MSDKLAFLDEPQGSSGEPAPKPEPAVAETPPPVQENPAPSTPAPAQPAQAEQPQPGFVPLAAVLDEREKRQALERERDELRRWREEREKQQNAAPPIDPLTEPEKWQAAQEERLARLEQDLTWKDAQRRAVRDFGPEVVQAAFVALSEECKTNPAFFKTVERQAEPYEFVVKWHKRQQNLARMGDDDPETFAEKLAKEKGWIIPERGPDGKFVAAAPAPQPATPLPKPSLASAPAAVGNAPKTPVGDGVAFNAAFRE